MKKVYLLKKITLKNKNQNIDEINQWIDTLYPNLKNKAKEENAIIFWGDQTKVRSQSYGGKTWYTKGETPIRHGTHRGYSTNFMYAISVTGLFYPISFEGNFNVEVCLQYLNELLNKYEGQKIYLILDNHSVHKSHAVKEFCEKNKNKITIYFLPKYAPELNPVEFLNATLKHYLNYDLFSYDKEELMKNIEKFHKMLLQFPEMILKCFRSKSVEYTSI